MTPVLLKSKMWIMDEVQHPSQLPRGEAESEGCHIHIMHSRLLRSKTEATPIQSGPSVPEIFVFNIEVW